jgi:hypothetical protein
MPTEIELRCDTIEECYEFTLSYAARGMSSDEGSSAGKQIRSHLSRAVAAMRDLKACCAAAIAKEQLTPTERYEAFFAVLARDAECAAVAVELVLAQPIISAQLIDNMNANIHLRALLTDLFLVTEILQLRADSGERAGFQLIRAAAAIA